MRIKKGSKMKYPYKITKLILFINNKIIRAFRGDNFKETLKFIMYED